jgi:hypothetical protein
LTETKNVKDRVFTTSFIYNLESQPLTITYPDNFLARYTYNPIGQTNEVYIQNSGQTEQQIVSSVGYSPIGQISEIDYTNSTISQMTYPLEQAYRLTDKDTIKATSTLQDISYTYDNVGNITQIQDNVTHQLAKSATYQYDDLYRLTNAQIIDNFTPTTTVQIFNYDIIGNILNKSDVGNYSYNNNNPSQHHFYLYL